MPLWMTACLASLGAIVVIAGVFDLAALPYLGAKEPKARLPDSIGREPPRSITGADQEPGWF